MSINVSWFAKNVVIELYNMYINMQVRRSVFVLVNAACPVSECVEFIILLDT